MAPRPKNPPPDRRQEILKAALQVFSRKGYAAATNAEIARAAGVTPAALYYYFPSKEDLFKAVISGRREALLPGMQQTLAQFHDQPPEVVIPALTRAILTFLSQEPTQALLRILLAEGPRNPEIVAMWRSQALETVLPPLLGYVQSQIEKGTIRPMDPRLFNLLLYGPIMALLLTRDLLRVPLVQDIDNEAFLEQLQQTLVSGLLAKREG